MQSFLKTIAQAYASRYSDLSRFCFIFPGRRSGTFFLKHLRDACPKDTIAPQTVTISDLVYSVSELYEDSRIDMLFLLYRCYCRVWRNSHGEDAEVMSIERFRGLGDTILSDFNDIDTHLADADVIYKNMSDLENIATDYLTDEQKEVMSTYFGIDVSKPRSEHFWSKFRYESNRADSEKRATEIKSRFLTFWESMAPLYHMFTDSLRREQLAYPGMAYRRALELLADERNPVALEPVKLVFIGFNVLTAVEWKIFKTLKQRTAEIDGRTEEYADFIWDLTGAAMDDKFNSASRYVRAGMRDFPKPKWLDLSGCESSGIPERINVVASPSNVLQAKLVCREVERLLPDEKNGQLQPDDIAVVLPDEGLLLPLLHSLPEKLTSVNLTMGLSLKYTPTVSYVMLLRKMQSHQREINGVASYLKEDVSALLSHPFSRVIIGEETLTTVLKATGEHSRRFIPVGMLISMSEEMKSLFSPLNPHGDVGSTVGYIDGVLALLKERYSAAIERDKELKKEQPEPEGYVISDSLTCANIEGYRQALVRLADACRRREVNPDMAMTFLLADQLISGEKLFFEGQPLKGVQIIGLLETRSLDFRHLIIPSMNERIFPRRMHRHSMIPNTLRQAYGLPTKKSQESIFSYYFYRMVCRAESVTMIYDARSGGRSVGEPSRYITQLEKLYARERVAHCNYRFSIQEPPTPVISAPKSGDAAVRLQEFKKAGGRQLSASSLNTYLACPLSFYFKYVLEIEVDNEPEEFMSSVEMGNIVHDVMEHIYLDEGDTGYLLTAPRRIDADYFARLLDENDGTISKLLRRAINSHYVGNRADRDAPLCGDAAIQHKMLEKLVRRMVEIDSKLPMLHILGAEINVSGRFEFARGEYVNLMAIIDRMDSINTPDGMAIRIVDYKTGNVNLDMDELSAMFAGHGSEKYVFQLLFYGLMARKLRNNSNEHYIPLIYSVFDSETTAPKYKSPTEKRSASKVAILSDGQIVTDADGNEISLDDYFADGLRRLLRELFDESHPFVQTANQDNCTFCNFRTLCKR